MNRSINRVLALALLAASAGLLAAGCCAEPWPRGMQSSLYMQTSGEYEALCLQVYRQAWEKVGARAEAGTTAATDENGRRVVVDSASGKQLCVVMDIDETVLDNSAYQMWMYENRRATWDQESWTRYMNRWAEDIKIVPGAGDFIRKCDKAGIYVAFISGRLNAERPGTLRTMRKYDILLDGADDPKGLRMQLKDKISDKTVRRASVAERFEVIAFCGDNLSDFDDKYAAKKAKTAAHRSEMVNEDREHFGVDWFVLPNTSYGDWLTMAHQERPIESLKAGRGEVRLK